LIEGGGAEDGREGRDISIGISMVGVGGGSMLVLDVDLLGGSGVSPCVCVCGGWGGWI